MSNQTNALREMDKLPISKAVLKNVLPAVAAMLMSLIYNMADKVFIGMANNDFMVAAITMATPVFVLFMSFGNIFGTGGVALISRLTGEGNIQKSRKVSSFCCWGSIGIGVVVMAIMLIFIDPIIQLLGASDAQTIAFTRDYLVWIAVCCPFSILSTTMSSLVRAEGKPTLSMIGMILGNVVNIVLDPIFILGFDMGTEGAVIATLIGQVVSAFFYLVCIWAGKSQISIKIKDFTMGDGIASRVFAIGTPAALATIFQSVCNILMNNRMSAYGDIAVAGIGAAQNIITIIGIFAIGVGMGIQPLLGYQIGNGNKKKFSGILRYSLVMAAVISLALTLLCYIFTGQIMGAFVTGEEAVGYGTTFARIIMTTAWLYCLFSVCALVLQAMGRATASTVVSLSRNAYVFIPVMYIMSSIWGMNGIVWALPISDVISIIIAVFALKHAIKSCFEKEESTHSGEDHTDLSRQFKPGYIITIGRSYGAGGRSVGKALAEKLDIPFYDKSILEVAAKESGLSKKYLKKLDETSAMVNTSGIFDVYTTDKPFQSVESIAYQAQKEAVENIASSGSCVIVGRRADQILDGQCPVLKVFVSSALKKRILRVMERDHLSRSEAEQKIRKVDKERQQYYNGFSNKKWGVAESYDLCVDTGSFGVDGAVDVIVQALMHRTKEHSK